MKLDCFTLKNKKNFPKITFAIFASSQVAILLKLVWLAALHSVEITEIYFFWQKFRESNVLHKEETEQLISRNIFWWEWISCFSTLCYYLQDNLESKLKLINNLMTILKGVFLSCILFRLCHFTKKFVKSPFKKPHLA